MISLRGFATSREMAAHSSSRIIERDDVSDRTLPAAVGGHHHNTRDRQVLAARFSVHVVATLGGF
jgi:hypothetical protein